MDQKIKLNEAVAIMRDAKWQINQMPQTHFNKASVLEIIDDIIAEISKEAK